MKAGNHTGGRLRICKSPFLIFILRFRWGIAVSVLFKVIEGFGGGRGVVLHRVLEVPLGGKKAGQCCGWCESRAASRVSFPHPTIDMHV